MYPDVRQSVKSPAIGLLVAGIANGLSSFFYVIIWFSTLGGNLKEKFADNAEKLGYHIGLVLPFVISFTTMIIAPLIIYGAIQMMNGRKYTFSKAAAILSIIPATSCCCLLGLPLGIWALVTLNKPEVRDSFQG